MRATHISSENLTTTMCEPALETKLILAVKIDVEKQSKLSVVAIFLNSEHGADRVPLRAAGTGQLGQEVRGGGLSQCLHQHQRHL